jgi:hypothetical protein
MEMSLLSRLVRKAMLGLEAPSVLRTCARSEIPTLLPYSFPIMATREKTIEDRRLLLDVSVSQTSLGDESGHGQCHPSCTDSPQ